MSALAQAIYNHVADNPGLTCAQIALQMKGFCVRNNWNPNSVSSYLSLMEKAKLVKVMPTTEGRRMSTFYISKNWDLRLGYEAQVSKVTTLRKEPVSLERALRNLLVAHGPDKVIAALQESLLVYGRETPAWAAAMTEEATACYEEAFAMVRTVMDPGK